MTCKSIIFVLLAGSITLTSFGQKKERKYSFFSEISVFRYNYETEYVKDHLIGSKGDLPQYSHAFDKDTSFRYTLIPYDSTIGIVAPSYKGSFIQQDFRNLTIGLSTEIWENKRFRLSHGLGLNYSISNTELGVIYSDHFFLERDYSNYFYKYDSCFYLAFHEQNRRIGLLYNISGAVKIGRSFRFSFALRNSIHLNYENDLYVQYHHSVTSLSYYFENDRVCNLFNCMDWRLFNNEKPEKGTYQVMEKRNTLQFDMILYSKPEFMLGPKKLTSFYFFYGVALKTLYGAQYKSGAYNPFYGIGLSRIINPK